VLHGRGANQAALNCALVADLRVLSPPIEEQRPIVCHLDEQTDAMRRLADEANEGIHLLNEYRSALIFAAVTGRLDVRTSRRDPAEVAEAG